MSFPPISELPAILDSTGWKWNRYETPSFSSDTFWVGRDLDGRKWLTKLRGGFYAYREIVFARIAQKFGWSCQSSTFVKLDKRSAERLGVHGEWIHAAHWFLEEHSSSPCSVACPLDVRKGLVINDVDDLKGCRISHILDWPRSEIAVALFGGNELPDRFYTSKHEFVIIDSEQMFSADPPDVTKTKWWNRPDGVPSFSGRQLTIEVCHQVGQLSDAHLADALATPKGVAIKERCLIASRLKEACQYARRFSSSSYGEG